MFESRRQFLTSTATLAGASLLGCSNGQPDAEPTVGENSFQFVPYIVGANTAIAGYGFFEAVDLLASLGFKTIEVQNLVGSLAPSKGQFPGFRFDEISAEDKERIRESLKPFDYVTVHLPYEDWMPYLDPADTRGIEYLEVCLDAAGFLGAKVAVLHPQPKVGDIRATWSTAVERIRKWGSMAADRGFQLACETAAPNSLPDLVRLHEEIGHDNVGVTLDVGHQARWQELAHIPKSDYAKPESIAAYNDLNIKIVETMGDKIIHFHTHDIDPETWAEHKPLIHGFIDYPRLIAKLREQHYGGVLVFEIGGDPAMMPEWLREGKAKMDAYLAA